ncbi:MAG: hypothetical protein LBC96_01190 [Lachnospiraceae bacterium]|jgi:hypothetical protein|nr:hypothetical protein [Lachnospiraceae bacterium]
MNPKEDKNIEVPNEPEKETRKFKLIITKQHWQGVIAALLVFVLAISALSFMPGVNLFGTLSSTSVAWSSDRMPTISGSAKDAFNLINTTTVSKYSVNRNSGYIREPKYEVSHIQGYAYYPTGSNTTGFNIFSHSDVMGRLGLIHFISDCSKYQWTLEIPAKELREGHIQPTYSDSGSYFNHPGGIQIIGDTLMVVVQASSMPGNFKSNAVIYLVDLTSLHTPKCPSQMYRLKDLPGVAATSIGAINITPTLAGITGQLNAYMIAIADNKTIRLYTSNASDGIWSSRDYTEVKKFNVSNQYQNIALFADSSGAIYMLGMYGGGNVHLYKLTNNNGTAFLSTVENVSNRDLSNKDGCHFKNGGGLRIVDGKLYLFATEAHYSYDNVRINTFSHGSSDHLKAAASIVPELGEEYEDRIPVIFSVSGNGQVSAYYTDDEEEIWPESVFHPYIRHPFIRHPFIRVEGADGTGTDGENWQGFTVETYYDIFFRAKPSDGWQIKEWWLNGVLTNVTANEFFIYGLSEPLFVEVVFEMITVIPPDDSMPDVTPTPDSDSDPTPDSDSDPDPTTDPDSDTDISPESGDTDTNGSSEEDD